MIKNKILTEKAIEVINKKLRNKKLTQQDSNYLSRFVRPKLRDITLIDAEILLKKLEYSPKALAIERKIKSIILKNIPKVDSIIVCGSVIQTNYKEFNDIDIIVATKNILTRNLKKKNELIEKIEKIGKKENLNLDVQIYAKNSILSQYPHNPSLIYQLKDSKVIYGKVNLPKKINLYNIDLRMKLDWSDVQDNSSQEIYRSLRNAILVKLLLKKIIDNKILQMEIEKEIGKKTIDNLKNNQASVEEKKLAKFRLKNLIKKLENDLQGEIWEKRVQLIV